MSPKVNGKMTEYIVYILIENGNNSSQSFTSVSFVDVSLIIVEIKIRQNVISIMINIVKQRY